MVATALAQVCAKSHQFPTFSGSKDKKAPETGKEIPPSEHSRVLSSTEPFSVN